MSNNRCSRIASFVLAMSLLVSLLLSSCTPPPSPPTTPTFRFDVYFSDGVGTSSTDSQTNAPRFSCLGLTEEDFEGVLLPNSYYVLSEDNHCDIQNIIEVALPGAGGSPKTPPLDWMQANWSSGFVYKFPAPFGWGGGLWVTADVPFKSTYWMPVPPANNRMVWAVLCADTIHCLSVTMFQPRSDSIFLASNVNGVFDPMGTAVTLLEKAWRRLSVDRPDLVPISVPAVNTNPYVPLTTPPY